jgi:glycosyltransferase involved in cell wall biosynthesis
MIFCKLTLKDNRYVSNLKTVSVVVSTYTKERLRDVKRCIKSLKRQTLHPSEIILVLDPNEELVNFYRSKVSEAVRIVVSDHVGLSDARNAGIKNANGEVVAFIDDDATADAKWLENLMVNYEDIDVVGVGGRIDPKWEGQRPFWFPEELYWIIGCSYQGQTLERKEIRNPIGCNMSFRRSVFEKVGYFRSDIGRFGKALLCDEETEFSVRALNTIANSKILYEPSAIVHHNVNEVRGSVKYLWQRSFYEGLSKAIMTSKDITSESLSTEDFYLKYLLSVSLPSRLRKAYKIENTTKILAIFISIFGVFAGFAIGRLTKRG